MLGVGDAHLPAAPELFNAMRSRFPEAGLIAGGFEIIRQDRREGAFAPAEAVTCLRADQAVRLVALRGNWIGIPASCFLHRRVIVVPKDFDRMPWVADLRLYLEACQRTSVAVTPERIARFVIHAGRLHSRCEYSLHSRGEEAMVRQDAAELYAAAYLDSEETRIAFTKECEREWLQDVLRRHLPRLNARQQRKVACVVPASALASAMLNKFVNRSGVASILAPSGVDGA
jgi:hypothetical protein